MEYRVSFADGVGVFGIILAVICLVLDKAGKLKGGWLVGLLLLAGAMTLFLAIGNSWVLDAPVKWKLWRGILMVAVIALTYSGLAIWISGGSVGTTESRIATPAPSPPFNINRSISLGNMTIIPRAADEPFTVIRMQLMPPLEDTLPDRYIINSVLLSFDNGGTEMDHNISLKLYLPGVREVSCDSDRIQVVEGNLGATFVNLLIPELKPDEKLSCKVDFTQIVSDIPTVTAWKKRFGSIHAWSELRQEFEVFIYRISFGPETPAPVGSGRKTMRAITIHPI